MTLPWRISCGLTLAVIWACSSAPGPGAVTPHPPAVTNRPTPAPEVLRLADGSVGPYLMPSAGGWVAAWAAPSRPEDHLLTWHTATFGEDGRPLAAPRALIDAPAGLSTLRLRALNAQRGLIVGAFESEDSDPEDPSYGLTALAISSAGTLLSGGSTLVQECDAVVWIDVVPLHQGALVVWAEDLGDHAELFATTVDLNGQRSSDLFSMHPNARAWQVVRHKSGAMLGVVTSDGNVVIVSVDPSGKPLPPQMLLDNHSARSDIDLAAADDRVLVAFSDGRNLEPELYSSWVSLDASLRSEPKPMIDGYGAATLLGLRATPEGVAALWQNTTQEPELVRLGRVDNEGRLTGPFLDIPLSRGEGASRNVALPHLDATATTLVVMAPPCLTSGACKDHADVLELNHDLKPQHRLTWPRRSSADLVWDFQCGSVSCAALSAEFDQRTKVRVLSTATAERTAVNHHKTSNTPLFEGRLQAVANTDELAALSATSVGGGTLVATLSAFDPNVPYQVPETPAPDGRLAPVQAQLKTFWFNPSSGGARGRSPEVENTVSIRARSVAGLDLMNAGNQALLVWTAIDNPTPQVFLTLLDAQGRKVRQTMLTRQSGEILAVSAALAPDGYFYVGWVREEAERNKVYVARLSPILGRQSADVLVATTKGTISRLDLAVTKAGVFAVLAQNEAGTETLSWLALNPATLAPKPGMPNPVLAPTTTAQSSIAQFSPRLETWGNGLGLAWLERSADASTAKLVRLDERGAAASETVVPLPELAAALDMDCTSVCRLALTGENAEDNQGYLLTTTIPREVPERFSAQLTWVTGVIDPQSAQVGAATVQDSLFYADNYPGEAASLLFEVTPKTP